MRMLLLAILLTSLWSTASAQSIYVNSKDGNDANPGTGTSPVASIQKAAEMMQAARGGFDTIKIDPGIYFLDHHVTISAENEDKRIVIEASVLPGDPSWTPEKMPVVVCRALKGEIPEGAHFVFSFLIDHSHVTVRGLKFHGYSYPHTRYIPVARLNKAKTDLLVEQCLFVGDANASQIQAGVIAHGNGVRIDHCVFHRVRNTVVFFMDSGNGIKTGNGITHSIIYGASQGVWTAWPDKDFTFENNVVANCRYVWVKNGFNAAPYAMKNCVLANNRFLTGVPDSVRLNPQEFALGKINVTSAGEIALRLTGISDQPTLDEVDRPLPADYMHVLPGTPGSELGAGLFKSKM